NRLSESKVIRCSTADEFLDAISPRGKYMREFYMPSRFLFRGHADDRYQLIPSVLRFAWKPRVGSPTNRDQVLFELSLVRSFYWMADRTGLPLPEDSQSV